jgi:hypothetical protein
MSTDGVKVSIFVAVLEKHEETVMKLVIVEFGRITPQTQVGPVKSICLAFYQVRDAMVG